MNVRLGKNLQERIGRELASCYPSEGGGFLLGAGDVGALEICDTVQVENVFAPAEQHHRYAMRPQDWLRLEDEAEARGLVLIGYYHSHPDAPAIPSEYDRAHALPNFVYLIARVQDGACVDMRVWRLGADRNRFEAGHLEIA